MAGFDLTRNYREAYGMHATSGILYNHESPRRGFEFVTRKITSHVAKIKLGLADKLPLGNLDAKRDWGHAKDYVQAMWLMLQQDEPDDYVIATGQTWSVQRVRRGRVRLCRSRLAEACRDRPALLPPGRGAPAAGRPGQGERALGWKPTYSFKALVEEMVKEDLRRLSNAR